MSDQDNDANIHNNGRRVRVIDSKGHLLFKFNPDTDCIEIKGVNRGGSKSTKTFTYAIAVDDLKRLGVSNIMSDQQIYEFEAQVLNE